MQISDRVLERLLSKHALVDKERLVDARLELARHPRNPPSLQSVLLNMGYMREEDLLKAWAGDEGMAFTDLEDASPEPAIVLLVPEEIALENGCFALERVGDQLRVAMSEPNDIVILDRIKAVSGLEVLPVLAPRGAVVKKLAEYHDHYKISVVEHLMARVRDQGSDLNEQMGLSLSNLQGASEQQAPIVRAVNLVIMGALLKRASDIHMVPDKRYLRVKYRVDGQLQEEQALPVSDAPAMISRIKILSKLDIAEKRMPQDGAFQIRIEGKEIDFRVATALTIFGEKVVMRVLDKTGMMLGLDHLGFAGTQLRDFKRLIHKPHGIVLIVGPTGSGKTTTLYSALNILNTGEKNITTVEDPVEYKIEGLTQMQTHAEIGLTFAMALRSILRQDPDIVLVGEVRDLETTEIAVRAALTGHLVFATLHTNDAAGAVARLLEMGAEPYLIASSLRCAMSQRLVRCVCQRCKEPYEPGPEILARLTLPGQTLPADTKLWRGKGCRYCFNTGYRGRSVISELLPITDAIREKIVSRSPSAQIAAVAKTEGMQTMYWDGVDKILRGITTLEEVLEVTEDEA